MKVSRVEFIKQHAWYLTIVRIEDEPVAFWSFHDRTGLTDSEARSAFSRLHFAEVQELTKQYLINKTKQHASRSYSES